MPSPDNEPPRVRVALVDDHELHRDGVRSWLASQGTAIEVIASAPTVAALRDSPGWGADVVLLDLDLRDGSALEANIAAILAGGAAVLMVSAFDDRASVRRAMLAGASGYASKKASAEQMYELIVLVSSGGTGMTKELAAALLDEDEPARPRLSPREVDVLRLYAGGMARKSVALRLDMAEGTVKEHVDRIRRKYAALGRPAQTKIELNKVAREDGFIEP